jgi:hypothetical protein
VYHDRIECDPLLAEDKNSVAHSMTFIPPHIDTIRLYEGNPPLYNQHVLELAALMDITVLNPDGTVRQPKTVDPNNGKTGFVTDGSQPPKAKPELEELKSKVADLEQKLKDRDKEHTESVKEILRDASERAAKADAATRKTVAGMQETIDNLYNELNNKKTNSPEVHNAEFVDSPKPEKISKPPIDNGSFIVDEKGAVTQVFPISRQLESGPSSKPGNRVYSPLAGPEHNAKIIDQIYDNKLGKNGKPELNVRPDYIPSSRQLGPGEPTPKG